MKWRSLFGVLNSNGEINSELHVQEKQSSHNNCAVEKEKEK